MGVTGAYAAMAGLNMLSSQSQANSGKELSDFTASQYRQNQKFANLNADDALSRGGAAAAQRRGVTEQQVGSERAAAAASGIDVNDGSSADAQSGTRIAGAMDELTIKNNAWKEAWGYKVQAAQYGSQAALTQMGGQNQYNNTLLTGGINAASYGMKAYGSFNGGGGGGGGRKFSATPTNTAFDFNA